MHSDTGEVMLAQEQVVLMRGTGIKKELEGELGLTDEFEGTLVLTDRRLAFVSTNEKQDDLPLREGFAGRTIHVVYSDVEDLTSIPEDPGNVAVSLSSISKVSGHHTAGERASLEVLWREGSEETGRVFIEVMTGHSRRKNLNDWAPVIERLMAGNQKLLTLPKIPPPDALEGKIMRIQADMQWRGIFRVEEDVEESFSVKLDPDEVQAACDKLCDQGLLKRKEEAGDAFYRKCSPLGDDDLSD